MNPVQPVPFAAPVPQQDLPPAARELGAQARQLMDTGQALCAPAVLGVLNQRLGGGLSPELVASLTAALPVGMHGSGCACGALNGGMLALGLFLGQGRAVKSAARQLHHDFKAAYGSTCCRALTKKAGDRQGRARMCGELTEIAAAHATQIILRERPELAASLGMEQQAPATPPRSWRKLLGVFKGPSTSAPVSGR